MTAQELKFDQRFGEDRIHLVEVGQVVTPMKDDLCLWIWYWTFVFHKPHGISWL